MTTVSRFKRLKLGTGLTGTDLGGGTIEVDAAGGGAVASDPIWDAKGDLAVASAADTAARLPVGSNDQVLTADSGQTLGVKWAAVPGGGIAASIVDAKGDLIGATANDTPARLAIGSDGQVLTADSAQSTGLKWAAAPSPTPAPAPIWPWLRKGTTEDRWYVAGQVNATQLSTGSMTPNTLHAFPLVVPRSVTIDRVGVNVVTSTAATNCRIGVYTDDGNMYPNALLFDSGNISTASTGARTATVSQAVSPGTLYWAVFLCSSGTPTFRGLPLAGMHEVVGYSNTLTVGTGLGWYPTFAFAALPGTFTAGGTADHPTTVLPAIFLRFT